MEVRATLRNIRMSASKGRLVADLVRRKQCEEALTILGTCPKRAAGPIEKVLRSALANAQEYNERRSAGIDLDQLCIKTIIVDEGSRMWRIRPRAMGRASWIKKQNSHVTVVLEER